MYINKYFFIFFSQNVEYLVFYTFLKCFGHTYKKCLPRSNYNALYNKFDKNYSDHEKSKWALHPNMELAYLLSFGLTIFYKSVKRFTKNKIN